MLTENEQAAHEALIVALRAIQRARELCERAEYGDLILGSLFKAQRDTQYALDTAKDQN